MGHLVVALLAGVRIDEVGLGLPPRLRRVGRFRGVEISLNWIPLGGFVRPAGEFDPGRPGGLAGAPAWARLGLLFAGPAANLLAAFALFALAYILGWPEHARIVEVFEGSPAERAGLQAGDVVLMADSEPLQDSVALRNVILASRGRTIRLEVLRHGTSLWLALTPRTVWPEGEGPAGFSSAHEFVRYPLGQALQLSAGQVVAQVRATAALPAALMGGGAREEGIRFLSPIGLKQVSDRVVENAIAWGEWFPILRLAGVLSVALGMANLVPLPALDGGRIALLLLEVLRRRRIHPRMEKTIHLAGMLAFLALTIVLVIEDLVNPVLEAMP
jgi:regulator of sigma E protease